MLYISIFIKQDFQFNKSIRLSQFSFFILKYPLCRQTNAKARQYVTMCSWLYDYNNNLQKLLNLQTLFPLKDSKLANLIGGDIAGLVKNFLFIFWRKRLERDNRFRFWTKLLSYVYNKCNPIIPNLNHSTYVTQLLLLWL